MSMSGFGIFCILVGFIVGLGAVIVIDIHGFLGRKSEYWTEAMTRSHKVTKPMIWTGMLFFLVGFMQLYEGWLLLLQIIISLIMIINGCFLTFIISPYLLNREKRGIAKEILDDGWQNRIIGSFILSFVSWWSSVLLFVYFLVQHIYFF